MNFFFEQIIFFTFILFLLFIPGYFLFLAIFGKKNHFHQIEKIVIYFGFSFITVNFIMLLMGKAGIGFYWYSIFFAITLFCIASFGIFKLRTAKKSFGNDADHSPSFGLAQTISIIIILFLTIFIKTIYLENTIFPTSTDLGHHMYWSKLIKETGQLPVYQEAEIFSQNGEISIGLPEPIADFIIGEHLIFSAFSILSGSDFVSAFPSLILFLANIATVLAIFILSLEIFKNHKSRNIIATVSLFFAGPLYALSSPQAKFVSGGVIGNTFGNFLIPLAIYFFIKAFKMKSPAYMATALFITLGLAYTHHLSTFVFIFTLIFSFLFFVAFNFGYRQSGFQKILSYAKDWLKIFFTPPVPLIIAFGIVMVFFVYTPTHLNSSAVDTAVGAPSKSTRTGLTFSQLTLSSGEARMILGMFGFFALLFLTKIKDYGISFLIGWFFAILMMTLWPNLLFVDIPSNRIANYIAFPLSILSAYAIVFIFDFIKLPSAENSHRNSLTPFFAVSILLIFAIFSSISGFFDNSSSLSSEGNTEQAVQTFESSKYLANFINHQDIILKDHNYITADSWMKLFFMRDYNFPLSRAYFKRYEDQTKQREQCTLQMISLPNSEEAKKCFEGTGTNFIYINPQYDGAQFKKIRDFWQVYASNDIAIFHKVQ